MGAKTLRVGARRVALKSCSDHLFLVDCQAFPPRAFIGKAIFDTVLHQE